MRFIRENPALAAGIGLPILVVILFFLAAVVPSWLVAPPRYDMLYTLDVYYPYTLHTADSDDVRYDVVDGHLKAYNRWNKNRYATTMTHLFLFDAEKMATREISSPPPIPAADDNEWHEFPIEETKGMTLDATSVAPDGYEFHDHYDTGEFFWPIFSSQPDRERIFIEKNARTINLAIPGSSTYQRGNPHFLGWITSGEK